MFGDTECDYQMVCAGCLELIPTVLTDDGRQQLAASLVNTRHQAAAKLRKYATALLREAHGEHGAMIEVEDAQDAIADHAGKVATLLTEWLDATQDGGLVAVPGGNLVSAADYAQHQIGIQGQGCYGCPVCITEETPYSIEDGASVTLGLHQFQCFDEGTLFYYQHPQAEYARGNVERCPVCGSDRVVPTGRSFPSVDENHPPADADILPPTLEGPDRLAFEGETPPQPNCPNPPLYFDHYLEINLWNMGDNWDWKPLLEELSHMDPTELEGLILASVPEGWTISGWDEHPHKDANGILAVFFTGGDCPNCKEA